MRISVGLRERFSVWCAAVYYDNELLCVWERERERAIAS